MYQGICFLALRVILFLSLIDHSSDAYAGALSVKAKSKALASYMMGVYHDLNGDSAHAIRDYQRSIRYNGLESAPRLKLGAYYLRLNKIKSAIDQFKKVTTLTPRDAQAYYLLALVYSSSHQYDLAARQYEIILQTAARDEPGNKEVFMYLGQLYYSEKKYSKAIEQFLKIIALDKHHVDALYLLGSIYADMGDNGRAISLLRQVLHLDPNYAQALNSLGYIYVQQRQYLDEAIRLLQKAVAIDPSNGAYWDSLGWAFYANGNLKEALSDLLRASHFTEDESLFDHLAQVYKALKKYPEASYYWHKSLDLNPHQPLIKERIKELKPWIVSRSMHQLN